MTNYERIKNMSVDELAEFINNTQSNLAIKLCGEWIVRGVEYIKLWLESEVARQ